MGAFNSNKKGSADPLDDLARLARLEGIPRTQVTANVLREIRVQDRVVAARPLMWLALGSSMAAMAVAIVAVPALMNFLDPLNAFYQTTSASLM